MQITALLAEAHRGDRDAIESLVPLVNAELLRIARNYLRAERSGHTLQPTDLIQEAYVRLIEGSDPEHVLNAIFKALGVALAQSCRPRRRKEE